MCLLLIFEFLPKSKIKQPSWQESTWLHRSNYFTVILRNTVFYRRFLYLKVFVIYDDNEIFLVWLDI